MAKSNPYTDLPPGAFWRSGVTGTSPFTPKGIYRKRFDVAPGDRIATAGSCFAQHIGRFLVAGGYTLLDVEPAPAWLPRELRARHGYGVYSARYGNIYTVAQLAQLAAECAGAFTPGEAIWRRGDRYFDALRPAVEPDGFGTPEDVRLARRHHLDRVRTLFREMDVLVFTLGLTEAWVHDPSGTLFPSAPGTVAGDFDETYRFVNLGYGQLMEAFHAFLETLSSLRGGAPPRIILTVSPVPLTATASGNHVLSATTYSKAVLRAVAGDLAAAHDFVDYFPSYEIVTNPAAHGAFFDSNLRTVRRAGVEAAMDVFFEAHPPAAPLPAMGQNRAAPEIADDMDVLCEEATLAAFGE